MSERRIQEAISNGYEFKTKEYFNKSLKMIKENGAFLILYAFVCFLISIFVGVLPFISLIINVFISFPLMVGFALGVHKYLKTRDSEFGDFFNGFDHVGPLAVLYLLNMLIALFFLVPFFMILFGSIISSGLIDTVQIEDVIENIITPFSISMITVMIILGVYLLVSLRWAPYLVVFNKFQPINALKTSIKLVNKNLSSQLIFMLLTVLIIFGGAIAFLIGLFVALPIILVADYFAFADVTGLNDETSEIDDLGKDLV